jgi:hypothetical protein
MQGIMGLLNQQLETSNSFPDAATPSPDYSYQQNGSIFIFIL